MQPLVGGAQESGLWSNRLRRCRWLARPPLGYCVFALYAAAWAAQLPG